MAKIMQEIFPGRGALNWDDDKRFMDPNDAEYRLNVIPNEFGNEYVITNMKGNTVYSHTFTHDASYGGSTYTCIGDCYDDNRDAIYYFIYSDSGNDSILRFNFSDNSFDKICWDHTGIGLDIDYPITDAFMIGDWLHFNPRTSSPRAINVVWAYWDFVAYTRSYAMADATTWSINDYVKDRNRVFKILVSDIAHIESLYDRNNSEVEFVDFTYQDVDTHPGSATNGEYQRYRSFYNVPEVLPHTPGASIETDTGYEYNNIRGRRFQFAYRLYVPDQGYTIASSFTDIVAPPSSETNTGEIIGDIQENNRIDITFPASLDSGPSQWLSWDLLFEYVEVLFREGPDDDWKIAERVYQNQLTYSNTVIVFEFFNDRAYEVVDNIQVEKQYNPLPKLAKGQWSLDGERSVYGGITEGFDNIAEIDVTLTTQELELTLDVQSATIEATTYGWSVSYNATTEKWDWISDSNIVVGTCDVGDTLKTHVGTGTYYQVLTSVADGSAIANAIVLLLAQGGITAANVSGPKVSFSLDIPYTGYVDDVDVYSGSGTATTALKYGSFKNGAWHPFCQYYYDEILRRCEPVFDASMRVYMETLPEVVPGSSTNYRRYIDWSVSHSPPSWAKYWRWGYAGNQTIDKFWQYNVSEISVQARDLTDNWTRIDISPLQKIDDPDSGYDHYFPNTAIDAYSFEPGDRVRFITTEIDKPATYDLLEVAQENKDYEILEFDDVDNYIYIDLLSAMATTTTTPAGSDDETYIIEIYRPKKQTGNTIYYEYGPLYGVYEDSGVYYHRGESQDQDGVPTPATGTFYDGDVFVTTRLFSVNPYSGSADEPTFVESYSFSDFQDSEGWGKGKGGVFTGIGETYLNNLRHSNRYSPNTKSSGLSTFDFLDYKELSTDHGNIVAMRQAGNTLKVYFERNSAAVLVNKQQIYNADGNSQLIKSDNVLGDAVYSNYHYGTIFPESVILKDRTVFFYDIYREAYIKDSSNGLQPISHNKMRRYFHEKSVALRASGVSYLQVYSAYDYEYNILYVHFIDSYDSSNDDVILFHEPQDKWVSFLQVSDEILSVPTTTTSTTSTSSTSTSSSSSTTTSTSSTTTSTSSTTTSTSSSTSSTSTSSSSTSSTSSTSTSSSSTSSSSTSSTSTSTSSTSSTSTSSTSTTSTSSTTFQGTNSGLIFGHGSLRLMSYIGEDVYIHNSNSTRNNFWGDQRTSIVEFISNIHPNIKKVFEVLAIHSNKPWDCNYISVVSDDTYDNGMQSKVPEAKFKLREGIFCSSYLRNMKTTSSSASTLDLIKGDHLRGYYVDHRLINDDTTEVRLFKIDVKGNISRI